MWNDHLLNLRRGDDCWAVMFANYRDGAMMDVFSDKQGNQAHINAAMEKNLSGEDFPLNDSDQYYELPSVPKRLSNEGRAGLGGFPAGLAAFLGGLRLNRIFCLLRKSPKYET